jgi:hypothetical protein
MVPLRALIYYWKNAATNSGVLKIQTIMRSTIIKRPRENLLNFACSAILIDKSKGEIAHGSKKDVQTDD